MVYRHRYYTHGKLTRENTRKRADTCPQFLILPAKTNTTLVLQLSVDDTRGTGRATPAVRLTVYDAKGKRVKYHDKGAKTLMGGAAFAYSRETTVEGRLCIPGHGEPLTVVVESYYRCGDYRFTLVANTKGDKLAKCTTKSGERRFLAPV